MTELDSQELCRTAQEYLDKVTEELDRLQEEIRRKRDEYDKKLLPMEHRRLLLKKQQEHLSEIVRMGAAIGGKPEEAKQAELGLARMTYGRAAREVLHPNKRMRLKDIYAEIMRRGYKLATDTPTQSSFSAAISTMKKHFAKGENRKYSLVNPEAKWWEKE